jgi:hypothetical protein
VYEHSIMWGASASVGDINSGDNRGDILYSMSFIHRINSSTQCEYSLQNIRVHRLEGIDGVVFPDSTAFAKIAWQGDCSWIFQPFTIKPWSNFRVGIGPSVRYLTSFITRSTSNLTFLPTIPNKPDTGAVLVLRQTLVDHSLSLGAVIKIDYVFPLSDNIELIVRGQLHSFLPAIINSSRIFAIRENRGVNLGSAGLFLRVSW